VPPLDGDLSTASTRRDNVLIQVGPLVQAGMALHWLRPRSKAPVADAWTAAPVYSVAELADSARPGANVGVRLGEPSRVAEHYLHVIDLDIRGAAAADEARAALRAFVPEYAVLPFVISGSGGESRHFYFLTERPFRSRKLAHGAAKFTGPDGKQHWAWEIELFGTGKQVVLPPSVHPDTGIAYRWGREIDFEELDMGVGPFIPESRVAAWAPKSAPAPDDDDDGLTTLVRAKPMGLTRAEIDSCLAALPAADYCEDRDGWLTVGMALHHEFEGSAAGLAVWNAFSARSKKYDAKDQARVWKSFESSKRPTRMATLIKAAAVARFSADLPERAGRGLPGTGKADDYGDDVDLDIDAGNSDIEIDDLLGESAGPDWTSLLDLNADSAIKGTLHNLTLIVANDPRVAGLPQYNEFTNEVVLRGSPGLLKLKGRKRAKKAKQLTSSMWNVKQKASGDLWVDEHDDGLRNLIEAPKSQGGYGLRVTDRDLKAALRIVADQNRFHPVREYLNSLTWDGTPRCDSLFTRYLGAADTAYSRSISRLTLLGAVVRAFEPGHKFDFVTILEGLQGKRKSTFIDILAKSWFAEIEGNFDNRQEMVGKMQGAWILELPELQGFGRHEVAIIKAFVSSQTDKTRLSYDRRARNYERQCIFIGSTNDSTYLRDDTGGRRFWPVACEVDEIDTEAFGREVDHVWAEAVVLYRAMRADQPHGTLPLYITDAEAKAEALVSQEDRRIVNIDDEMAGTITAWLDRPVTTDDSGFETEDDLLGDSIPTLRNAVCSQEVWRDMLGEPMSRYGQSQQQQIGRALKKVPGWFSAGRGYTEKFGRQRIFRRQGILHV